MLSSSYYGVWFYRHLICHCIITTFCLSLAYYSVVLFIILLRHFICVKAIQTDKADLISQMYQIMVVSILKNWSRYYIHYIIKFVGFYADLLCY